jgi:hypothetical protein
MPIASPQHPAQVHDTVSIQAQPLNRRSTNSSAPNDNRKRFIPGEVFIPLIDTRIVQRSTSG